jgi:hypothetical protein
MATKGNSASTTTETEASDICLVDPELWVTFIRVFLKGKPDDDTVHCLAHALAYSREAIDRGPDAVAQLAIALDKGVKRIFRETPQHKACFRLFSLGLLGYLKPEHEVLSVLAPAVEAGEAEAYRSREMEELLKAGQPLPPIEKPEALKPATRRQPRTKH